MKLFFVSNRRVTPQAVLEAFLGVLEPFLEMVNEIYRILNVYQTSATGGNDFALLYDETMKSLSFDLEQFKRYETLYREVMRKRYTVRFHSDFVPGFRFAIKQIYEGQSICWPSGAEPKRPQELQEILRRLHRLAYSHQQLIQEVIADWGTPAGYITKTILAERYGVSSADGFEEFSGERIREWADHAQYAVDHIPLIDEGTYCRNRTPSEVGTAVSHLRRILDECGPEENRISLEDVQREFLELPYWKKRWQVFEVWIVMNVAHRVCPAPRGKANTVLAKERYLVLRTGESAAPKFIFDLNKEERLEIWLEYALTTKDRPDIAIIRESRGKRVVKALVECKQRESENDQHYLSVAARYADGCPEDVQNCIVNYDAFLGPQLLGEDKRSHASRNVCTLFLDRVVPGTPAAKRFQEYLQTLSPPAPGLMFIIDNTSSMKNYRASVLDTLSQIVEAIRERGPIPIAAVLYGDHCDAPDRLVQFIPWSEIGSEIISKVEAAEEAAGGDIPEALEDALHEALKRLEELGSIAHLFVFTDAPPHSSGACPKGLDFEEQVVSLLQLGVSITLVPCGEVSNPWWDLGWSKFKGETLVHLVKLDDLHGSVRSALMV